MGLKMLLVLSKILKAQASKQSSHFLGGSLRDLGYFWGQTDLETQAAPIPSA